MEYRYSYVIDPNSYDNQGLCDGIPLRVHRNTDLEEAGTIRFRHDWQKYVDPSPPESHNGAMGPIYNFTSVAIPECRPDRLEIVSYAMELAFIHDDVMDSSYIGERAATSEQAIGFLKAGSEKSKGNPELSGKARLIHDLVAALAAIDPVRADQLVYYWTKDLVLHRDRAHFADIEDYMEFRVVDSGSLVMTGLVLFGMCLTIPDSEKEECERLTRSAWLATTLTNDIESWDKEFRLAETENKPMTNGLVVLMEQYSIGFDEAKALAIKKTRELVAEYLDTVKNLHNMDGLSLDSKLYIEAVQYFISGNVIWGFTAPRYHSDYTLTDLQISRVRSGWPCGYGSAHETKRANYLTGQQH